MAVSGLARTLLAAGAAATLLALGTMQFCSDVLLRGYADADAPVAHMPAPPETAVEQFLERFVPTRAVRAMLAMRAVRRGDLANADVLVAALPPSHDREELTAQLADLRGHHSEAMQAYLIAGDWEALTREVSRLDSVHDYQGAMTLEQEVVGRLQSDRTHPDALAEAWWRLGLLDAAASYRAPAKAKSWKSRALVDYEHAAALAPFAERYLLAAAGEAWELGRLDVADSYYRRVVDVDPKSASGYVGLATVALTRGNAAEARLDYDRARAIDDQLPDVRRLARKFPA